MSPYNDAREQREQQSPEDLVFENEWEKKPSESLLLSLRNAKI